jgi:hypothetical protein
MKILISAIAVSIAFAFGATEKPAPSTYFYFCTSRPKKASGSKQLILYTPVKKIVAGEKDIESLTKVWGDTVAERRGDPSVGTSDFNYYLTAESADSVLLRFKAHYSDTVKYDVRVVGFFSQRPFASKD